MSRIIQILIKNHVFFLFIFLEFLSLKIFISNSFVAESSLSQKMTTINGQFFNKEKKIHDYFFLKKINDSLLIENERLFKHNLLLKNKLNSNKYLYQSNDFNDQFITQSNVLRNSWNKKHNFITI